MSGLSVRVRFEVFKRDRFTCAYCGKHPPDVLLVVDHILPRAAGGGDEPANLTTACSECNGGKSDRLLEEGQVPAVTRERVDDLRERVEQAAAFAELVGQQSNLIEQQVWLVNEAWARAFGATPVETPEGSSWSFALGRFPDESSVRGFVRRIPVTEILAAVDITGSRFSYASPSACRYFYKICWNRIKGEPIDGPATLPDAPAGWVESQAELAVAYLQIDDLKDEIADLRAIIATYQDERRTRRLTRIGDDP